MYSWKSHCFTPMHTHKCDDHYPICSKLHSGVSATIVWPYHARSCIATDDLYLLIWVVVVCMSRKHMEQSGCSRLTAGMLNRRCTICNTCEPCSAIRSLQKPVFRRYLPIRCAYNTHRYLDLEIWWFSCRRRQQWWQTYRPITLPLAHACRVINEEIILVIYKVWGLLHSALGSMEHVQ